MFSAMVAVRLIFRNLGEDALGVIYFTWALNSVLCGALEMGVSSTVVREVAVHRHDDPAHVNGLVRTASAIYWFLYLILAMGIFFAAPTLVHHWIQLTSMTPDLAVAAIRILGIAAVTVLPRSLYASILRGLEKMEINNTIDAALSIVQQAGVAVILFLRGDLLAVTWWLAGTMVFALTLYVVLSGRMYSWRPLRPGFSRTSVARTFKFTTHMALSSILSIVHIQADKTIVSRFMAIGELGYYGIGSQLVTRATLVTNSVAQAAYPSLAASIMQGDRTTALRKYHKLQDLVCVGIVPLFAGLVFSTVPLFSVLFNRQIALQMVLPIFWLSLGQYLNGSLTIPYLYSVADDRPDIAVRQNSAALFLTVPLTIWLTIRFGLSGAAFSWVAYHIFALSYGLPAMCRECLEMRPAVWYWSLSRVLLLAGSTYGIAWYVSVYYSLHTLVFALSYISATIVFCLVAWQIVDGGLRKSLRHQARQLLFSRTPLAVQPWL
jgi:O-antigen/teichoic acid export membrane protein